MLSKINKKFASNKILNQIKNKLKYHLKKIKINSKNNTVIFVYRLIKAILVKF